MNLGLLSAAYLLSGVCALIYETVWIYKFSRIFGSTVFAMSFVVALFFAGLALGSRLFGRSASRSAQPLRLYAWLEIGIGLYALVFPLLIFATDSIYALVYPAVSGSFGLITLVRVLLAFLVIFPPTLLMGGTLPVLLTHFADRLATLGPRSGLIYGLNALGAALGSFLSGYALLQFLGVTWTNATAAALNLVIGGVAMALSRTGAADAPSPRASASPSRRPSPVEGEGGTPEHARGTVRLVIAVFALSGFVSMSYEVLWLRYLSFYFHETIYLYSGIITFFVLGIGLGSLIAGYVLTRIRRQVALLGWLQAGIGTTTVLALYLPIPQFQPIYDAGVASASSVLWILLALLIVPALLMGATFPVVTKIIVSHLGEVGSQVGRAYALNTLGCILGLLGSGFVLHNFLGMQLTIYLLFALNMLAAAVLLAAERDSRRWLAALPLLAGCAGVFVIQASHLGLPQSLMTRRPNQEVIDVREGLVGITWVTRTQGTDEFHLWENGIRISRGGRSTFLSQGFIPMLIAPRIPREVLGLAFGAGLSYRAARLFPEVRRMDCVDISKDNILAALKHLPENAGFKDDPRARFILDDAYSYVKYSRARYDLILMEPTPPRFCYQTASLYTREFYDLARQRLTEGGYFGQVLPLNDLSPTETVSVMRTFGSVFGHCLLWRNGWDCLMLGSDQPFRLDIPSIAERLRRPDVQKTLRECAPLADKFYQLDSFISGLLLVDDDFRQAAASGSIYTDDNAGLRFTTGRAVTTANIRNIHEHLSPWPELRKLFDNFPEFDEKESLLTIKRQYIMALLYTPEPQQFCEMFTKYIEEYSPRKDEDREALRKFMLKNNMTEQADELETEAGD